MFTCFPLLQTLSQTHCPLNSCNYRHFNGFWAKLSISIDSDTGFAFIRPTQAFITRMAVIIETFILYFVRILNQNRISNLSVDNFSSLTALKRLWINDNQLNEVPTHVFEALPKLEAL